jgi:hypothetical protein
MNKPILDFYRCPEEVVNLRIGDELGEQPEYFEFGPDLTCYGRSSVNASFATASGGRYDLSRNVQRAGSTVGLPFDLSEIIENLHRERYTRNGYVGKPPILTSDAVRRSYYALRPLLGVPVRRHLQKYFLRNWQNLTFPTWPVDTTVERLLESVLCLCLKANNLERLPFIWFWPNGASACAMVTHDVETQCGIDFVPDLMDIDESFGIMSSFQVVPEGSYPVSPRFLSAIRERGFEIGVQDLTHDGNLFDDRKRFRNRAESINRYIAEWGVTGFRSGRMYRNVDWYDALDICYDMSVPNVAHLEPQRGGCCTVFPYFIGDILELPLTAAQDYSVFHILGDYSVGLWKKQVDLIRAKSGLASFIIHPDYVRHSKALAVYKSLLQHLGNLRKEEDVWIALPREVDSWWRDRSQMTLKREGTAYRIEGPGKERARVAYAKVDGNRLVYEVEKQHDLTRTEAHGWSREGRAGLQAITVGGQRID